MRLRNLFTTFIVLSWIQFSAENNEYLEVWKPEVNLKSSFLFKNSEVCVALLSQVRRVY